MWKVLRPGSFSLRRAVICACGWGKRPGASPRRAMMPASSPCVWKRLMMPCVTSRRAEAPAEGELLGAQASMTPQAASLLERAARGGMFLGAGQLLAQLVQLFVPRFFTPADYGLVGMVTIVQGFLIVITDLGLTAAL